VVNVGYDSYISNFLHKMRMIFGAKIRFIIDISSD